ncbi:sensor histidine kinase [Miltoncostaea oceani]|uniref:sensor histidine kinase n=1 Tax=Miltoncostaea oceani TaxID=2843216 RepID=UPI001C3D049E|nr:sensor histidine kinase [Miltoncostaea oceani]
MRAPLVVAWSSAVLAVAAVAVVLVARAADADPASAWGPATTLLVALPAVGAGVAIARTPGSGAIGPLVALLGLTGAADAAFASWADAAGDLPGAPVAALAFSLDWLPVFSLAALLLLLFPDGRPPSPRWRPVAVLAVAGPVAVAVSGVLREDPLEGPYADLPRPGPAGLDGPATVLAVVGLPVTGAALVLAAAAMVVRFRRAEGVPRVQLKWLAVAAGLIPAAFAICLTGVLLGGDVEDVAPIPFVVMYVALVTAVAVAMLRHGLFDVDRAISRTLAWATLTLLLVVVFAGVALLVAVPLGGGSAVATAVAALTAAAVAEPSRRRLQSLVDRRFDRDRAAAVARVEAFAARLREGRAEPEDVEGVLRVALADPGLRVLVWAPDAGEHRDLAGAPVTSPAPAPGQVVTVLGRGEAPLGLLVHDARLRRRAGLLVDIARAAALPVEMARLRGELRHRLDEVEESRIRLVRAGYEERRRLTRDLHDGVQQRLVAVGMGLRRLQRGTAGRPEIDAGLDHAVDEISAAVRDLREMARGLRPGALDGGLAPALADLARRTPLPVDVEGPRERVSGEVEAAAYYVACEAIANAVKHAGASRVVVRALRDDGGLRLSVSDDGRGGAEPSAGGGLAGVADRVAAHGGALVLDSRPGHGTRLEVTLPCVS